MGEQMKQRHSYGFTIVEVMIVLAVTGIMFMSAALLVNGRQNRTEFTQAIGQVQSQVQQAINDVINGYSPNVGQFKCQPNPSGNIIINSGNDNQGQHGGCIFLGKVMQFAVQQSPTPSNQPFDIYSVVGSQCISGSNCSNLAQNQLSTSISNAEPTVLKNTNNGNGGTIDATDRQTLENGLNVTNVTIPPLASMWYNGNRNNAIGAVGFLQSLANYGGGGLASGSQQVGLWAIKNTSLGQSEMDAINAINTSSNWQAATDIEICFSSATTTQSGLITIGGSGRQLLVGLKIYSTTSCL